MNSYLNYYVRKNMLNPDSVVVPSAYNRFKSFSAVLDDDKVAFEAYLQFVKGMVYDKAEELCKADKSIGWERAKAIVMEDSLRGKTKEYIQAMGFVNDLKFGEYNAKLTKKFLLTAKCALPGETVEKALKKYHQKQGLIGNPLHEELAQAVLADSANNKISFGEMMASYKGKVVYMDIWSLTCGPCRQAMRYSKILKERLANEDVEFVYLTVDSKKDNLWDEVFKMTQTKENHFRFKKRTDSRLHKFLDLSWVPCYLIFDKEGKLVDLNAERPTPDVERDGSKLVKQLTDLAQG